MGKLSLLSVLAAVLLVSFLSATAAGSAQVEPADVSGVTKADTPAASDTGPSAKAALRAVAMGLTLLAAFLTLAEILRLRRVGPYLRVLMALLVYYAPLLGFPVASAGRAYLDASSTARWVVSLESLLVMLSSAAMIGLLLFAFSRLEQWKRSRALRVIAWTYVGLALLGSAVPTFFVACLERLAYTGILFRVGLAGLGYAGVVAGLYLLSAGLERWLGEKRSIMIFSVLALCASSAIQLYWLS